MAEGFRARDATTNAVLVTLDTHLTKLLGFFNTGIADGSIADGNLANGTPFFATLPPDNTQGKFAPSFTINAAGISWTWVGNPDPASRQSADVTYGFWT